MTETLYIMESGSYLRRVGESLKVFNKDAVIAEIPADGLKKTDTGRIHLHDRCRTGLPDPETRGNRIHDTDRKISGAIGHR
jgi:hypothetical protein